MLANTILSNEDLDLLVEMFCCVIAADKKVSGREVDVVITALTELGQTTHRDALKTKVVDYCKAVHKKGVDSYVADVLQRAKRLAGLPLATSFIEAQPTLLCADGASTPDEERVSQQIVECLSGVLVAAENEPIPDVPLEEPAATFGTSMLGTAKSSMALAGATAERTKITTVTLPAAFIALGKHCTASKAFSAEFPSIYAAIARLAEETKATAEKLAASSTASTFAGKAQELASRGMTLAISQKQSVQYQKLMHDLGKAVYESQGAASGPKDLCERISKCKQRLEHLATSVTTHSRELKDSAVGVGRSAVEAATSSAKPATSSTPQQATQIGTSNESVRSPDKEVTPAVPSWKVAAALVCLFPYGIYLLWNHPTLGRSKWWWRFAMAFPFIVGILGAIGSPPRKTDPNEPSPKTAAQLKEEQREMEEWERKNPGKVIDIQRKAAEDIRRSKHMQELGKPSWDPTRDPSKYRP
jgi:hypothetical protein